MTILVTDHGFAPADPVDAPPLADLTLQPAVTLGPTDRADAIAPHLHRLTLIRIAFPAFNDGRGFTLARDLRQMGYTGRLHATGPLLADQYTMARRSGFDAVEIPDEIATRQPWAQWQARAGWRDHDHRARLFV